MKHVQTRRGGDRVFRIQALARVDRLKRLVLSGRRWPAVVELAEPASIIGAYWTSFVRVRLCAGDRA